MVAALEAEGLRKRFVSSRDLLGRARTHVVAVDDVSLHVERGETLAVVGESGSGKSTVGRLVLRLLEADAGTVRIAGTDVSAFGARRMRPVRATARMIFQDPFSSLHPRMVVGDAMTEPLVVHGLLGDRSRDEVAVELCGRVGLNPDHLARYPYELSGGQLQRIAIARAICTRPALVVCDEPVAALDMSVQSLVVNLLRDLQDELGLAYLFISHDVSLVRLIADRVAVMYHGRVVESGPVGAVLDAPAHPYTGALIDAVPRLDPAMRRARFDVALRANVDVHGSQAPTGCPYAARCPLVEDVCTRERPELVPVGSAEVACHVTSRVRP
ncbi:MAG: ABC transporter ATP-binding protein [Acidimicrobiia bacterium]